MKFIAMVKSAEWWCRSSNIWPFEMTENLHDNSAGGFHATATRQRNRGAAKVAKPLGGWSNGQTMLALP